MTYCDTYWRTHGCSKPPNHEGQHRCSCGDRPLPGDRLYNGGNETVKR